MSMHVYSASLGFFEHLLVGNIHRSQRQRVKKIKKQATSLSSCDLPSRVSSLRVNYSALKETTQFCPSQGQNQFSLSAMPQNQAPVFGQFLT